MIFLYVGVILDIREFGTRIYLGVLLMKSFGKVIGVPVGSLPFHWRGLVLHQV